MSRSDVLVPKKEDPKTRKGKQGDTSDGPDERGG